MINLVLVRHSNAEDVIAADSDFSRNLTKEGKDRAKLLAKFLFKNFGHCHQILHSPLVRAEQTAKFIYSEFSEKAPEENKDLHLHSVDELLPATAPHDFCKYLLNSHERWLKAETPYTIMGVGHEPNISRVTSYLLCGRDENFVAFKKAGAACVQLEYARGHLTGTLLWFVRPKVLGF